MKFKRAADYAFSDMKKYFDDYNIQTIIFVDNNIEVLIPTKKHVYTKESRRLNKELKISKVNYKKK